MTSEELNKKIREVCDREDIAISGGKSIPYVGWYWRDVDFNVESYCFGIIPGEWAGFMENNKWGYDYTRETTPIEWHDIKRKLEILACDPSIEHAEAAWDAIQAVAESIPERCSSRSFNTLPQRCCLVEGHEGDHSYALEL